MVIPGAMDFHYNLKMQEVRGRWNFYTYSEVRRNIGFATYLGRTVRNYYDTMVSFNKTPEIYGYIIYYPFLRPRRRDRHYRPESRIVFSSPDVEMSDLTV